jgi:hypothetical protein
VAVTEVTELCTGRHGKGQGGGVRVQMAPVGVTEVTELCAGRYMEEGEGEGRGGGVRGRDEGAIDGIGEHSVV